MRRITPFVLAAALVVGASSVSAEDPAPTGSVTSLALLQASPSASPAPAASGDPAASPVPSAIPSAEPCPSPAASPDAVPSVAPPTPDPSAVASPGASASASAIPGASVVPSSPTPSPVPSIDPCASPDPTDRGFRPNRVKLDLVKVADGLPQPVYVTGTGDDSGDLFLVLREGEVRILDPRTGRTKKFLDISGLVDTINERGLHAIALDPRYARNGHFYVHFNGPDGDTQVVRYTGKPGDGPVKTSTAKRILRLNQPFENHNGGWLGFGPDGRLYLALGDGGGNTPGDPLGNGQDRGQPLAKILRVDPDTRRYTTYAWGLRNPWRASFDRETGDLWIGDVGQDEIEEIDIVKAGRDNPPNFGWSVMEGSRCHRGPCNPDRFVLPVAEYSSAPGEAECSVIGGYVYRGEAQPLLQGAYVYGDFCSGRIWALRAADGKPGAELKGRQMATVGATTVVSFGEGDDGELYVITGLGGVFRLVARERGGGD